MLDYPIRYRLRKVDNKWYVETTRTWENRGPDYKPAPVQLRHFTPIAQIGGQGLPDNTILADAGREQRGGRNLYTFWEEDADRSRSSGFGRPWVGIWGDEPGVMSEEIPIPRPKTKRDVRWSKGHWQESFKSGWRDIPYEWIDPPSTPPPAPKPKRPRKPKAPASKRVRLQGPPVGTMEGFALTPAPERTCIGPRKLRRALEDALEVYDENEPGEDRIRAAAETLSLMSEHGVVSRHAVTEAIDRDLGTDNWLLDYNADSTSKLMEVSEDEKLVKFHCDDEPVASDEPPESGSAMDGIRWALLTAGMDPDLAPIVRQALEQVPTSPVGDYIDRDLENLLTEKLSGQFLPYDWKMVLVDALQRANVIMQAFTDPYKGGMIPPIDVPRTPEGLAKFFADLKLTWDREADKHRHMLREHRLGNMIARAREWAEKSSNPDTLRMVEAAAHPRLMIQDPSARDKLAELEGDDWDDRQKVGDPNGILDNLIAFQVLREMGPEGAGLAISDLVPGAGFIAGDWGHGYVVMPDGEIVLIAETADAVSTSLAHKFLRDTNMV